MIFGGMHGGKQSRCLAEGQFLRPQHFQQMERSIDARLKARADGLGTYP
ncbi:MAG: hypothetical protein R3D83_03900 [Caenibius sp.]